MVALTSLLRQLQTHNRDVRLEFYHKNRIFLQDAEYEQAFCETEQVR